MVPVAEALLVVDMQQAFVTGPNAVPDAEGVMNAVSRMVHRARGAGAVVVHLQNDGHQGSVDEPHSPGWALAVQPQIGEQVIRKHDDDGFVGTDLETKLRGHGVSTLVVCGVQSEMCVAATVRAAMARRMTVVLPRDSHGTYSIPADGEGGVEVPAAQVARVAEWSLGDEVVVVDRCDLVSFRSAKAGDCRGRQR